MRSFHVIVNPAASGGAAATKGEELAQHLRRRGAEVALRRSPSPEAMNGLVAESVAAGAICVAAGGDGMVDSAVTPAVRQGATLAIAPLGRGNDFARQLGIPTKTDRLVEVLLRGEPSAVDVIDVGRRFVASSVYAGVDSHVSQIVNRRPWIPGLLQYPVAAVQGIATFAARSYRVTIDGKTYDYQGFSVVAANSGYYGKGMHIAPDADPTDGLLDVVMIATREGARFTRPRFIAKYPHVYRGTHTKLPEVTIARGREVTIEADNVEAYADGERLSALPVTARVVPGGLSVLR
ncbi:diacylglycerol kinase family lipid kinase [Calidifontibacter sp. DB0510]|uniref:Diacylglycerol kinase family lipid kinase n=1 Tax=Metallococcus carri TaxID=1656884 RepID=A0A967EEA4_9MICO|nr:diacylglycerol kinase family protein [Metallococcus carri]NHN55486.1 diacylglycerol kinase family lipid kinase [Metallococcus carri]NOP38330.1 diacylglycerol kinase family lipid kinase [Calidifontibacter sp. DB2511S]